MPGTISSKQAACGIGWTFQGPVRIGPPADSARVVMRHPQLRSFQIWDQSFMSNSHGRLGFLAKNVCHLAHIVEYLHNDRALVCNSFGLTTVRVLYARALTLYLADCGHFRVVSGQSVNV